VFGAEPLERLSIEEAAEFERYASDRLKGTIRNAIRAGVLFGINVAAIVPFLSGYPLHKYWGVARFMLFTAMVLWVWFVYKAALIWASWQATRDTRREFDTDEN
jgi:hypothetical protein